RLAGEVGFVTEREMLRIPSTRNACIVGRRKRTLEGKLTEHPKTSLEERLRVVEKIVERETGTVEKVGREWRERAEKVARSKGTCH
ncbi:hypothetical protein LTS18_002681, partial [Coniosporium uncinatum]